MNIRYQVIQTVGSFILHLLLGPNHSIISPRESALTDGKDRSNLISRKVIAFKSLAIQHESLCMTEKEACKREKSDDATMTTGRQVTILGQRARRMGRSMAHGKRVRLGELGPREKAASRLRRELSRTARLGIGG